MTNSTRTPHKPLRHIGGGCTDRWMTTLANRIRILPNGCWQAGDNPNEYQDVYIGNKAEYAHRVVFGLFNPQLDITDLVVHHQCQRPACVNPAHLIAMTSAEHANLHAELRALPTG